MCVYNCGIACSLCSRTSNAGIHWIRWGTERKQQELPNSVCGKCIIKVQLYVRGMEVYFRIEILLQEVRWVPSNLAFTAHFCLYPLHLHPRDTQRKINKTKAFTFAAFASWEVKKLYNFSTRLSCKEEKITSFLPSIRIEINSSLPVVGKSFNLNCLQSGNYKKSSKLFSLKAFQSGRCDAVRCASPINEIASTQSSLLSSACRRGNLRYIENCEYRF